MSDKSMELLERADSLLDKVAVSGANAYFLVDARRTLKQCFDLLKQEKEEKSG